MLNIYVTRLVSISLRATRCSTYELYCNKSNKVAETKTENNDKGKNRATDLHTRQELQIDR